MRRATVLNGITLAVILGCLPAAVVAAPFGNADFAVAAFTLSSSGVDFIPAGGGTGSFDVGPSASGLFAGLAETTGTVKDLSFATIGMPISVPAYFTFAAAPTIVLELTFISAGVFGSAQCGAAPAAGQVCTPPGSPLNFINLATAGGLSAVVSFTVAGTARNPTAESATPFTATYTAEFTDLPYQNILSTIAGGGSVAGPYAAGIQLVSGPLSGGFGIGTTALAFSTTGIDFIPAGGTTGTATLGLLSSGSFSGLGDTTATLKDLSYASQPVGVPILLSDFVTFAAAPVLRLNLTLIRSAILSSAQCFSPAAAGQVCAPPGSALNLVNLPNGAGGISAAAFFATQASGSDLTVTQTPFDGVFGVPLADQSYQVFLAALAEGAATTRSYSARFNGVIISPTPTSTPTATPTVTTTASATATRTVPRDNGVPCTKPAECASGFCVDTVCCNRACNQPGEACDRSGAAGMCAQLTAPVPAVSSRGLVLGASALLLVAALALRRRYRLARHGADARKQSERPSS
jgi:hypothetical protein